MRFYSPTELPSLTEVVDVKSFLAQESIKKISPFKSVPVLIRLKIACLHKMVDFLQGLFGVTMYVKNDIGELVHIDSRVRSLLLRLSHEKIIAGFERAPLYPDAPAIVNFRITLAPILLPNGEQARINGSQGNGVGETLHDALIPAIAEALERHATATWQSSDIIQTSSKMLKDKGGISVGQFSYFSPTQLSKPVFAGYKITDDTILGWTSVRSLVTGKKHFVPAQLIYLFFNRIDNGSYFLQTTTNGVAAHVSEAQATYRALCELIERDAVMIHWLNQLAPNRIDLSTISVSLVQQQIQLLAEYGFEVHILDLTSDMKVPVVGVVLIDVQGTTGVSLTSACGYDVDGALQNAMFELLRFAHKRRNGLINESEIQPDQIRTMKERSKFWSRPDMEGKIRFLLAGKVVSYTALKSKGLSADSRQCVERIKGILKQKGYDCYVKNISSSVCIREGLKVVRVLVPQLVPVYFNEQERPYGMERLYAAPLSMGYQCVPKTEDDLNQVPHPFI